MRPFSLEGKLAVLLILAATAGVFAATALVAWWRDPWPAAAVAAIALVPLAILTARSVCAPALALLRALVGNLASFRDGDFSVSLAERAHDELGDLARAHNELGRVLREERQSLSQREILLDAIAQHSPTAVVLADAAAHIVFANHAANAMLNGSRRMNGLNLDRVVGECPPAFAAALRSGRDELFTVEIDGEEETFHLAQRDMRLRGQKHRLLQLRRVTRELSRQEAQTWKKVIRVISHELNNSLAPISSLAYSGRELTQRGDTTRLAAMLDTIGERARHLGRFIQGYAEFARLPPPRIEEVPWNDFLARLTRHYAFVSTVPPPAAPGRFDRTQIEQALINLLKNAHESGSAPQAVELDVLTRGGAIRIEVRDRGTGMTETALGDASLPFYSTKRNGSGLGLALAREIVQAHGGRLTLANRQGGGLMATLIF